MRKHTPGPWSIYFNSQDDLVIRKLFADGHESHAVARCHSGIDNALLIAAAPKPEPKPQPSAAPKPIKTPAAIKHPPPIRTRLEDRRMERELCGHDPLFG